MSGIVDSLNRKYGHSSRYTSGSALAQPGVLNLLGEKLRAKRISIGDKAPLPAAAEAANVAAAPEPGPTGTLGLTPAKKKNAPKGRASTLLSGVGDTFEPLGG